MARYYTDRLLEETKKRFPSRLPSVSDRVRYFLDENFPEPVADGLRSRDVDLVTAQELGLRQTPDHELLAIATQDRLVVVTLEPDFLELARPSLITGASPSAERPQFRAALARPDAKIWYVSYVVEQTTGSDAPPCWPGRLTSHEDLYSQAIDMMKTNFLDGMKLMEAAFKNAMDRSETQWAASYASEIAICYKVYPDKTTALRWAHEAYKLAPHSIDANSVLGSILWELGHRQQAKPLLEAAASQGDLKSSVIIATME